MVIRQKIEERGCLRKEKLGNRQPVIFELYVCRQTFRLNFFVDDTYGHRLVVISDKYVVPF